MDVRWTTVAALALLAAGCGSGDGPEFRTLPGLGNHAMIVAKDTDPATFPALAKARCGSEPICSVYAWTDPASAATALPLTDRELAAEVFAYTLNRNSGLERSLWDCSVYPRPKEECLAKG